MAKVTQDVAITSDPNWLNQSKGPGVDRSFSTLFEGVGQIGQGAFKVADEGIKQNIKKNLYDAFDSEVNSQGVGAAALEADVRGGGPLDRNTGVGPQAQADTGDLEVSAAARAKKGMPPPPGLTAGTNTLQRLRSGYDQGGMSDTHYFGRLETIVRNLRAQYPGYRDEIDQMVSSVTGITPANALRRSLQQDMDTLKNSEQSAKNHQQNYFEKNQEDLTPDQQARWLRGDMKFTELQMIVGEQKNSRQQVTNATNRASYEDKVSANYQHTWQRATTVGASSIVDNVIRLGLKDAVDKAVTLDPTKTDPKTLAEVGVQVGILEKSVTTQLDAYFNEPVKTTVNGVVEITTRAAILGDDKVKAIRDSQARRITGIRELVEQRAFGEAAWQVRLSEAKANNEMARIMDKFPEALTYQALTKMLGPQAMQYIIANDKDGKIVKSVIGMATGLTLAEQTTNPNAPALSTKIQEIRSTGVMSSADGAKYTRDTVDKGLRIALDPGASPEATKTILKNFFKPENQQFLALFTDKSATNLFARMTSKEISERIKSLNDPELLQTYSQWTKTSAQFLIKGTGVIDTFNDAVDSGRSMVDFSMDDKTGRIVWKQKPGTENAQKRLGYVIPPVTQQAVDKLNQVIDAYAGSLPAGTEVGPEVHKLLRETGKFDLTGQKKSSFWGTIGEVLAKKSSEWFGEGETFADLGTAKTPEKTAKPIDLDMKAVRSGALGDVIGIAESGGGNYNIMVGGRELPLDQVSVAELPSLQTAYRRTYGEDSGAAGKFQTITSTFKRVTKALGLPPETKLTPEVQEQIGDYLIRKDGGGDAYLAGKIDKEEFADRLAGVWAGLPLASGRSAYAGVGGNKATVSRRSVLAAIDRWTEENKQ